MCMCMGGLSKPNLLDRNLTLDSRKPDLDGTCTCSSNRTYSQPCNGTETHKKSLYHLGGSLV